MSCTELQTDSFYSLLTRQQVLNVIYKKRLRYRNMQ
jgi:hypothetical protein